MASTSSRPEPREPRTARAVMVPLAVAAIGVAANPDQTPAERVLTGGTEGGVLTNHAIWSADSAWLAYDLRANPDHFTGTRIERVEVATGRIEVLYESRNGACCGVVTWSPDGRHVVFMHGFENPTPDWTYGFSRRYGVLVDVDKPGQGSILDAATYAPPFVPGALRGGSHVHQFSPDGRRISFTYDDEVLRTHPDAEARREGWQRNVGVAVPAGPVTVPDTHARNHDGAWFCVLVSRTVPHPVPGSDEISRACEEGWIGTNGYRRADGSWQRYALAIQGVVTASDGREHTEVYVIDLPEDLLDAGDAPLEGTVDLRPAPPRGVVQRRLTYTEGRRHRGLQGVRHWLRASPDGTTIACLMRDDAGVVQLWGVPTVGGEPRQISRCEKDVDSTFSWSPNGRWIAHLSGGSVCATEVATGVTRALTPPRTGDEAPLPLACVVSPDGRWVAYQRRIPGPDGVARAQVVVVEVPEDLQG